ncbi:hypothetical protein M1L60_30180 [Actinoplanes sp. TRM 88003]|uniref:Uncharacterized protein n=1 Tax=Paractinoplanes aksuensis TaxID=2939490 RepID=A0ABT1DVH6_9ACTN|nr:hypothetical protein [Actinoplanes aksuensis]MCO8274869.1 hypothetical protein [Actinoplanes aksuensis]
MIGAGIAFGVAVARAQVLSAWTGWTLVAGMVLMEVSPLLPAIGQVGAAAVRTWLLPLWGGPPWYHAEVRAPR